MGVHLIVKEYVPYLRKEDDYAPPLAYVSSVAASAKRRHSAKGPPKAGDDEVEVPATPGQEIPPPPDAPEGASEVAQQRAQKRRNLYDESRSVRHLLLHSPPYPYCKACRFGKGLRVQHRRGAMKKNGDM